MLSPRRRLSLLSLANLVMLVVEDDEEEYALVSAAVGTIVAQVKDELDMSRIA